MEKTPDLPIWVYLAFSSIEKRSTALLLIYCCIVFCTYCVPWMTIFPQAVWEGKVFRLDDWSWFLMMVPMTLWYWLALRWVDRHSLWQTAK